MTLAKPSDADVLLSATEFRRAIDAAGPAVWKVKHIDFPRGSCGHAAELLAYYLHKRFGIVPDYISQTIYRGDVGGWHGGHAWLEWNGLTIDVSGDQFGWPPVVVTRNAPFHGRGEDEQRYPALSDMTWCARECGVLWRAISAYLLPEVRTPSKT